MLSIMRSLLPLFINIAKSKEIYNGNWADWSAIWSEIKHLISKSNERAARVRFEILSIISDQNCTIQSLIATFWNRKILKSQNLIAKSAKQKLFCVSFSCNVIG